MDNIEFGRGITGAAAETRKVIRVGDVRVDARYIENHEDIRSEVAVPLILHDRVIGVMDLESVRLAFLRMITSGAQFAGARKLPLPSRTRVCTKRCPNVSSAWSRICRLPSNCSPF